MYKVFISHILALLMLSAFATNSSDQEKYQYHRDMSFSAAQCSAVFVDDVEAKRLYDLAILNSISMMDLAKKLDPIGWKELNDIEPWSKFGLDFRTVLVVFRVYEAQEQMDRLLVSSTEDILSHKKRLYSEKIVVY